MRLYPLATVISKQLLPVYNKSMTYYPLSMLMMAGIRGILIVSAPEDLSNLKHLLGDGSQYGVGFSHKVQPSLDDLAQALILGEEFIDGELRALVLGDNIFYGNGSGRILHKAATVEHGTTVFGYYVDNPERYGVVELDENRKIISTVEKLEYPANNHVVTDLYSYDERVTEFARQVRPSSRSEPEATDLNRMHLEDDTLNMQILGRGYAWLDTGTMDSLYEAGEFACTVQRVQGLPIAAAEEIAFEDGQITRDGLMETAVKYSKSPYGKHLKDTAESKIVVKSRDVQRCCQVVTTVPLLSFAAIAYNVQPYIIQCL